MKICSKCKTKKLLSDFWKDSRKPDGLRRACKNCLYKQKAAWIASNKNSFNEANRQYAIKNIIKVNAYKREWAKRNKEKIKVSQALWRKNHPEIVKDRCQRWRKNNPERTRELRRIFQNKRYATVKGNLEVRMATGIYTALQNNKAGNKWESLVGYSVEDLKRHLESKFTNGITWDAFMQGKIHIDHIMPKSRFHYENPKDPEFKICWGLTNLQPLWAKDNLLKHDKTPEQWEKLKVS